MASGEYAIGTGGGSEALDGAQAALGANSSKPNFGAATVTVQC